MVVPVIQEPVKNKELLIEVDSIVNDNKDNLANVSLSSNDSLSKSRRKWRLIRIINKLNPALAERKYQFPTFKFFFALFLIILTSMIIYWSLSPRSVVNSKPDCPSAISLKSSAPQPVSSLPTEQASPRIPIKISPIVEHKSPKFPPFQRFNQILSSKPSEELEDFNTVTPNEDDFLFDYPFSPVVADSGESFAVPESLNFFDQPDSDDVGILWDPFADLPEAFEMRSSGVNSDMVFKSVDKFINFFKSIINF